MSGLDLAWLHLWGVNFAGVRMVGVDLSKAQLVGAILDGADLSGARLVKTEANSCLARGTVFADTDMLGIRMNNAELRDASLRRARLNGAHLSRSDLRGADFRGVVFGPPGPGGRTVVTEARVDGCRVEGAGGSVRGPVDVQDSGGGERVLIGGARLVAWFAERGAAEVHVEE
ncbi:pentapeptide repeat-containing protein [Allonocardiopsis opalescens]|uniref:pentapeptide repeat-containing protein n=1 Tax=Allonocardiopsis opalescens TaxID=1144618 RepID=UPI0014726E4E|nr:pentapeptide repeat-containing protein [Allonocardiopsis opalescens]